MASPSAQAPGFPILDVPMNCGVDMSSASGGPGPNTSYQYCAAMYTANDLEVAASSSLIPTGAKVAGVLQNQPKANEAATVRMLGVSKLVVDGGAGAIAPGDSLKTDGSSRGIKTTTANDLVFAIALQNSSATGDIISVFLTPGQLY